MSDDITALIAATLVRAHAASKVTSEQLASRTADFLSTATQVRDALHAAGWLNDSEEQVIARQALDFQDVQKLLRDKVAKMVALEREKHVADGRAEERRLWLEGRGNG